MKKLLSVCLLFLLLPFQARAWQTAKGINGPEWRSWSNDVFVQAKQEHRFVLLDLEAVWCHWCHVMDETTYRDPAVIGLLQSNYITVKVDQDSRPDLSNRYEDYGWPATIVFDSDGHEIVKRRGYLEPRLMASMLRAIVQDPSPGPSVQPEAELKLSASWRFGPELRKQLYKDYLAGYDQQHGSWGKNQKFLDWDSVEYSMALWNRDHNAVAERMARQTLTEQMHLLDPHWGGVYQYSTGGDWNSPHFEKIMQMQAENLRIYSLGYAIWHDPAYLHAAQEIRRYLKTFLTSPEGGFYTSQDADLVDGKHSAEYFALNAERRKRRGIPRVDQHMYARENGWGIAGLVQLYAATGDASALNDAIRAAQWVMENRSIAGGGFKHDAHSSGDPHGPDLLPYLYLGDTISMARAFLSLYGATADRKWLSASESALCYIAANFSDPRGAGYDTAKITEGQEFQPQPQRDENVMIARTANLLFHYTGNVAYQKMAQQALAYLTADPVVYRLPASSILLADMEAAGDPLHLTIIGPKNDRAAQNLFQAALSYPSTFKRLEWWDAAEGPLPNPDVQYPQLSKSAAFVCTNKLCSSPVFSTEGLAVKITKLFSNGWDQAQ